MIRRLTRAQLKEITDLEVPGISEHDRDEMAIPSYLHPNPLVRWLMWKRYAYIAELASFSKNHTVLEFGCGPGVFLPTLSEACGTVYAVDLFPQYAAALVKKLGLNVEFLDALSELPDRSLDLIIAADVLEHFDDPTECIVTFRSKLKREGRLIVSGPTENKVYKIGRFISGFSDKGDYHHTNIDTLIKSIQHMGFGLSTIRTLPFRFPPYLFKVVEFEVVGS